MGRLLHVELLYEQELVDADTLYMMPPSRCQSQLQMPVSVQPPPQAARGCFQGTYDVESFINALRYVRIVERIPEIRKNGKIKKIKAFQIQPPRDAPVSWYTGTEIDIRKLRTQGHIKRMIVRLISSPPSSISLLEF